MKSKEIVLVRVMGGNQKAAIAGIRDLISQIKSDNCKAKITLFRNCSLPTDLSVHIDYHDEDMQETPIALAHHLSDALKEFGMISHSVWKLED